MIMWRCVASIALHDCQDSLDTGARMGRVITRTTNSGLWGHTVSGWGEVNRQKEWTTTIIFNTYALFHIFKAFLYLLLVLFSQYSCYLCYLLHIILDKKTYLLILYIPGVISTALSQFPVSVHSDLCVSKAVRFKRRAEQSDRIDHTSLKLDWNRILSPSKYLPVLPILCYLQSLSSIIKNNKNLLMTNRKHRIC